MVVVDTTVWMDYLRGAKSRHVEWLERELGRQPLALTDPNLCEVLQGVGDDRMFRDVLRELTKFKVFSTGGVRLATAAAENYRVLRAKGRTVRKTIDCLIATFCLLEGHALLHNDRDFDAFVDLRGMRALHH